MGTTYRNTTSSLIYQKGDSIRYSYTGSVSNFHINNAKTIRISCFGACGYRSNGDYSRRQGGYISGCLDLTPIINMGKTVLYVVVGEGGANERATFGGGGAGSGYQSGGGASDVRLEYNISDDTYTDVDGQSYNEWRQEWFDLDKGTLAPESLKSRIIVAGGSGGDDREGAGGDGSVGGNINHRGSGVYPAPNFQCGGQTFQRQQNYCHNYSGHTAQGTFGIGASANDSAAGSGGGYYGGTSAKYGNGGSSYIQGYEGCVKKNDYNFSFTNVRIASYDYFPVVGTEMSEGNGLVLIEIIEVAQAVSTKTLNALVGDKQETVKLYTYENSLRLPNRPYLHNVLVEGSGLYARAYKNGEAISEEPVQVDTIKIDSFFAEYTYKRDQHSACYMPFCYAVRKSISGTFKLTGKIEIEWVGGGGLNLSLGGSDKQISTGGSSAGEHYSSGGLEKKYQVSKIASTNCKFTVINTKQTPTMMPYYPTIATITFDVSASISQLPNYIYLVGGQAWWGWKHAGDTDYPDRTKHYNKGNGKMEFRAGTLRATYYTIPELDMTHITYQKNGSQYYFIGS